VCDLRLRVSAFELFFLLKFTEFFANILKFTNFFWNLQNSLKFAEFFKNNSYWVKCWNTLKKLMQVINAERLLIKIKTTLILRTGSFLGEDGWFLSFHNRKTDKPQKTTKTTTIPAISPWTTLAGYAEKQGVFSQNFNYKINSQATSIKSLFERSNLRNVMHFIFQYATTCKGSFMKHMASNFNGDNLALVSRWV